MVRIGKNILENITTGMYEDSKIIYREYIQNAADSIDKAIKQGLITAEKARIEIYLDVETRTIEVHDNALGISRENALSTLINIADSDKNPEEEKGFRGIGRLGGIAYCNQLTFETSYKGENTKTIMHWDAKKSREIFNNPKQRPTVQELLADIVYCYEEEEDVDKHYFIVRLDNVIESNNDLLNKRVIQEYLEFVAPVPYAQSFYLKEKIYKYAKENNFNIDEYNIFINNEQLFKGYVNNLYEKHNNGKKKYDELLDLDFKLFKDKNNVSLAWSWVGISHFNKQIPVTNKMRGIRLRKSNIQIGDSGTLSRYFREDRGGYYFVGEIHSLHTLLIPNARRDYFNENEIREQFEGYLHSYLGKIHKNYHYANKIKLAIRDKTQYFYKREEFKETQFLDKEEEKNVREQLKDKKKKAERAKRELELRKAEAVNNPFLTKIFKAISQKNKTNHKPDKIIIPDIPDTENKDQRFLTQNLSKLTKKEQRLIRDVFGVIKKVLPKDEADILIKKIQEELNK